MRLTHRPLTLSDRRTRFAVVAGLALLTAIVGVVVHLVVRRGFLDNMDERNYLWLAHRMLEGRVTAEPIPSSLWNHCWVYWRGLAIDGSLFTHYPAIWPAQLAIGAALGAPWIVSPLLAGGTVILVYLLVASLYKDRVVALCAASMVALCPFVTFQAGTLLSHVSTAFWLLAGALSLVMASDRPQWVWPIAAGIFFGFAFSARPLDAIAVAAPVIAGFAIARRDETKRLTGKFALVVGGGVVGLLPFFLYNKRISGSYLTPTMTLLGGTKWVDSAASWTANLTLTRAALSSWDTWFLPAWLVAAVWIWLLTRHRANRIDVLCGVVAISVVAGYSLYAIRYDIAGPRFHFMVLYPALILCARLAVSFGRRVMTGLIVATICYFGFLHVQRAAQMHRDMGRKRALDEAVERAGIKQAIVFIPDGFPFGIYARDLLNNSPDFHGVVYAIDLGRSNESVRERFPALPAYRWSGDASDWPGKLLRYEDQDR